MAIESRNDYQVSSLIRQESKVLIDIAQMMGLANKNQKHLLSARAQDRVNRLILLENENSQWITDERWILINQGSSTMTKTPELAPVIAAGFKHSS